MKLGAFTDDLHTDFGHAAALAAENRLDAVAVRNVHGRNIADLDEAEVTSIRRVATEHGLEIASIASQFGREMYLDDDDGQRVAEALLARALRNAEICETPLVRCFAAWLPGQEELSLWTRRPPYPESTGPLVERLLPSVRMAERAGVTLMLELEGASYVGTVAEAITVIAALDSPAVALCWDVCNGWWSGENPADGLAKLDAVRVVDVQTKDVPADPADSRRASLGRAVVGEGDIGYDVLLPRLAASGYTGYVTAERVHHPVRPEDNPQAQRDTLADIAALRHILATIRRSA